MGALTAAQMLTELQRRITQLNATDGAAAINRAVRWINRQGSFTFQVSAPTTLAITVATGLATTPATMDVGKAHVIYNPNGTPIRRVGVQDVWQSSNFNVPAGTGWDCYTITGANLVFFPAGASQPTPVNIIFHAITTDISGAQVANTPKDFDDLIIDLAEAEERRVYDVGEDWAQLLARSQDQAKVMLDGYRSTTMEAMTGTEAKLATEEKLSTGRS